MNRIFPFDFAMDGLANGLRLITVPLPWPGVVSLYIVVHAGSRNEVEEGRSGFAHFFEHLMFRGTPEYPPERYEAVMQEAGAATNAYTDDDQTVYHTTLAKEEFPRILALEADRFLNLQYSEEDFRTEALAILGEYNKDSAEPVNKLFEVLRDKAFVRHTYKHTTMGFLRDIERMPGLYGYSRQFFDRFYRPERTTMVVAGDIGRDEALARVQTAWGGWARGGWTQEPEAEPAPAVRPRTAHIDWPSATLPHLVIGFHAPAFSAQLPGHAALDLAGFLGFSETSALYQRLVIDEQVCDQLYASNPDRLDPYLFTVFARVKKREDVERVRELILAACASLASRPAAPEKLDRVKRHLKYRYALSLNHTEAVAWSLAHYVTFGRTPEVIDQLYRLYEWLTPDEVQTAARQYFTEAGRSEVTLWNS